MRSVTTRRPRAGQREQMESRRGGLRKLTEGRVKTVQVSHVDKPSEPSAKDQRLARAMIDPRARETDSSPRPTAERPRDLAGATLRAHGQFDLDTYKAQKATADEVIAEAQAIGVVDAFVGRTSVNETPTLGEKTRSTVAALSTVSVGLATAATLAGTPLGPLFAATLGLSGGIGMMISLNIAGALAAGAVRLAAGVAQLVTGVGTRETLVEEKEIADLIDEAKRADPQEAATVLIQLQKIPNERMTIPAACLVDELEACVQKKAPKALERARNLDEALSLGEDGGAHMASVGLLFDGVREAFEKLEPKQRRIAAPLLLDAIFIAPGAPRRWSHATGGSEATALWNFLCQPGAELDRVDLVIIRAELAFSRVADDTLTSSEIDTILAELQGLPESSRSEARRRLRHLLFDDSGMPKVSMDRARTINLLQTLGGDPARLHATRSKEAFSRASKTVDRWLDDVTGLSSFYNTLESAEICEALDAIPESTRPEVQTRIRQRLMDDDGNPRWLLADAKYVGASLDIARAVAATPDQQLAFIAGNDDDVYLGTPEVRQEILDLVARADLGGAGVQAMRDSWFDDGLWVGPRCGHPDIEETFSIELYKALSSRSGTSA